MGRVIRSIGLILLLAGMTAQSVNIQLVRAKIIVVPDNYSTIQAAINAANAGDTVFVRAGTYQEDVVANKTIYLLGEDQNAVIELEGIESEVGIEIASDSVFVSGFTIQGVGRYELYYWGVQAYGSLITVTGNTITNVSLGVEIDGHNNTVAGNLVTDCGSGIILYARDSLVSGNELRRNGRGILLYGYNCENDIITDNLCVGNSQGGIRFVNCISQYLAITNNTFVESDFCFGSCATVWNSAFYHNDFINSSVWTIDLSDYVYDCVWDNGYPSGGNYWSCYNGTDVYSGPYQNETGSDGIGDTHVPLVYDYVDRYPLMNPSIPTHDIAVINVTTSKTVMAQGFPASVYVAVKNHGDRMEAFTLTAYANATIIQARSITLGSRCSALVLFVWNTAGYERGNYTLSVYAAPVANETDTENNSLTGSMVYLGTPGDIDGNGVVNMLDLYYIALYYGSEPPYSPYHVVNYDIDCNDIINMLDLYIAAIHFGQTGP